MSLRYRLIDLLNELDSRIRDPEFVRKLEQVVGPDVQGELLKLVREFLDVRLRSVIEGISNIELARGLQDILVRCEDLRKKIESVLSELSKLRGSVPENVLSELRQAYNGALGLLYHIRYNVRALPSGLAEFLSKLEKIAGECEHLADELEQKVDELLEHAPRQREIRKLASAIHSATYNDISPDLRELAQTVRFLVSSICKMKHSGDASIVRRICNTIQMILTLGRRPECVRDIEREVRRQYTSHRLYEVLRKITERVGPYTISPLFELPVRE